MNWIEAQNFGKRLVDTFGKYQVYVVDGETVRNSSPELQEFGISSDHHFLPSIPENEIWIDDDIPEGERPEVIAAELFTVNLIDDGVSKDKAYKAGLQQQRSEREARRLATTHPEQTDQPADKTIYVQPYGYMPEGIVVWLVNGKRVRDRYKTDFWAGGNPWVYHFVPNREIWLELTPHEDELPYTLLHEFVEMTCMKLFKIGYDEAHRTASKVEFHERQSGHFNKKSALSLTRDKVLTLCRV